jgi:predicted HTH transcriptional regulator
VFALRVNPSTLSFVSCPLSTYEEEVRKEKDVRKETRLEDARERVLDCVAANPGSSTRDVEKKAGSSKNDNAEALESLVERGDVVRTPRTGKGGGWSHFLPKDVLSRSAGSSAEPETEEIPKCS